MLELVDATRTRSGGPKCLSRETRCIEILVEINEVGVRSSSLRAVSGKVACLSAVKALEIRIPGLYDSSLHPSSSGAPGWCSSTIYIHRDRCVVHPPWSISGVVIGVLWYRGSRLISLKEALLVSLSKERLARGSGSSKSLEGSAPESSKRGARYIGVLPSSSEVVVHHHFRSGCLDGSFLYCLVSVNHRWSEYVSNDTRG